ATDPSRSRPSARREPRSSPSRTTLAARSLALPRHLHHRGPQDATLQLPTGAQHVGDVRLTVALVLEHGLVLVGIERGAGGLDAFEAGAFHHAGQLGEDELDALADLLVDGAPLEVAHRELEAVEYRQQLLEQALGGPFDQRGLL